MKPQQSSVDVLEGNRIIAEFMGRSFENLGIRIAKYHSSWDWLMPVLEKIGRLGYIQLTVNHYHQNFIYVTPEDSKESFSVTKEGNEDVLIECAWQAAVRFITWYNTQTKKQ